VPSSQHGRRCQTYDTPSPVNGDAASRLLPNGESAGTSPRMGGFLFSDGTGSSRSRLAGPAETLAKILIPQLLGSYWKFGVGVMDRRTAKVKGHLPTANMRFPSIAWHGSYLGAYTG
jgi:hypothetical protein